MHLDQLDLGDFLDVIEALTVEDVLHGRQAARLSVDTWLTADPDDNQDEEADRPVIRRVDDLAAALTAMQNRRGDQ